MANYVYSRHIGGVVRTTGRDTFLEIAQLALAEIDDKRSDYFGTIEGAAPRYVRWDSESTVREVVRIIEKGIWHQQIFLAKTARGKDKAFAEYLKYEGVELDMTFIEFPWCHPDELKRLKFREEGA